MAAVIKISVNPYIKIYQEVTAKQNKQQLYGHMAQHQMFSKSGRLLLVRLPHIEHLPSHPLTDINR